MSVIDELRKEGSLSQAYDLAKERLKSNSNIDLIKRDLARVLTDLLQKHCYSVQADHFFNYLDEFYALQIPKVDSVIHENIMWQVGKFIKELTRTEASSDVFDRLYAKISHVELPPGTSLFTFITSSVLDTQELNDTYIDVLLKFRVRHLPTKHFLAINEDGEKKPSLGELQPKIHRDMIEGGYEWDATLMPVSVVGALKSRAFEEDTMPLCKKHNIAVLGMKGFGGSRRTHLHGQTNVEEVLRYALSYDPSKLLKTCNLIL